MREALSIFDQELVEVTEMMEAVAVVKAIDFTPEEKFYSTNRSARRQAGKRNKALRKRDPRG